MFDVVDRDHCKKKLPVNGYQFLDLVCLNLSGRKVHEICNDRCHTVRTYILSSNLSHLFHSDGHPCKNEPQVEEQGIHKDQPRCFFFDIDLCVVVLRKMNGWRP